MLTLKEYIRKSKPTLIDIEDADVILHAFAGAAIDIAKKVSSAGIIDILGSANEENVQGEEQQKLDVIADNVVIDAMKTCKIIAAVASEENEDVISLGEKHTGKYVAAFDPLDGSSNIDVNISIGTIFSVFKRKSLQEPVTQADFLRTGREQVLAGYVIYGSATLLVFTLGDGVQCFTLDPERNEFKLTHPNICTPNDGKIYSLNEGNSNAFSNGLKRYIEYCKSSENTASTPYSARYIGSLVGDFHRNLLKGGIFIYPGTSKSPNGKLRLLYECLPMAMIVEQAGGQAHNGQANVMDLTVEKLHQRIPFIIGSKKMVQKFLEFQTKVEMA